MTERLISSVDADDWMRLENITAQASALALMTCGDGGKALRNLSDITQDNVMWLLCDLVGEIRDIVNGRGQP